MLPETVHQLTPAGLSGLTAFATTFLLTPVVRAVAVRFGWVSRPQDDRWGRRVIARMGGVAMGVGLLSAMLLWVPRSPSVIALLIGLSLVFTLGLVDDVHRLPPYTKLVAQLLIGCGLVVGGIRVEFAPSLWLSIPLSVLWFVLIVNAFNLLDNMDGLAAGIGAIGAGFCALHAILAGQWTVAALAAAIGGACAGLLRHNFPPARIFMGDSGSHLLGLSLAALATMGTWKHPTQLLSVLAVPTLVLAVPIFDTCFVTLQRLLHRQHPFIGGTDHVSHRLAVLGLSVRQTVLALYLVSGLLGVLSVVSVGLKPLPLSALWLSVVTGLILVGGYLARVNVYRLERTSASASSPGVVRPTTTRIETMLLHKRRLVEVLADFLLISCAYVFAYLLRFEGVLTGDLQALIAQSLPMILVIKLACFAGCGLYQGMWRYLSLSDVLTVVKAVTIGSTLSALALLYLWRFEGYSRAVLIIDWLVCILAISGSRVVERLLDEWIRASASRPVPVLIVGAGDTGERVLRHLRDERTAPQRVIGFLDDDARKHGNWMHGVSVLGGRNQLARVLDAHQVREVLVAISDPPGDLLQQIRDCCEPRGVSWKVVTAGVMHTV